MAVTNCPDNEMLTDFGCIPDDPVGFVAKFYGIGLGMIVGIAFLFIIWGGYQVMTSKGNPNKLQDGKTYIIYSIIGILLAVFGFVFIRVIAVDILRIPGFN